MSTYVLVHGAWHGAWCWDKVVPYLEQKGQTVIALDLPAHGQDHTPVANITPQSYTQSVLQVVDAQSEPVILVGHSMSGVVISQVAEQRPAKIHTLVYLTAALLPNETLPQVDPNSLIAQSMIVNELQGTVRIREEALKEVFYADCSDEDIVRAKSLLVPESLISSLQPLHISENRYGHITRFYIECLQDKVISLDAQRAMYHALPCQRVISMNTSHSPFFSAPEELAEHLTSLRVSPTDS